MKTICSFCGTEIHPGIFTHDPVSHGVCEPCFRRIRQDLGLDIRKFLDTLDAPVLLVDNNAVMLAANTRAIAFTRKPLHEIRGQLCGKVLDCINAGLNGGCGKRPDCPDCTIRSSVTETWTEGTPVEGRLAVLRRKTPNHDAEQKFLISTRKDGGVVLLRIEPVES